MICCKCNNESIVKINGPEFVNITLENSKRLICFNNVFPVAETGIVQNTKKQILNFSYCLNCGQIQNWVPIKEEQLESVLINSSEYTESENDFNCEDNNTDDTFEEDDYT
jgi:hypothetical protein